MRTICAAHTYSNSIEMLNAWAFHIPISVSIDVLYDSDLLMILIIKSDFFKPCSAHLAPLFLFSVFEVSKHGHFITTKDMTKKSVEKSHDHEIFQSSSLMKLIISYKYTNRFFLSHFSFFLFSTFLFCEIDIDYIGPPVLCYARKCYIF